MNSYNLSRFPSNNISVFHWTGFIRFKMPPAKSRDTLRDAIDIIQNGESEVEMELNDTDESEDSDSDVCPQVDKENQPPMDCPTDNYVDIEPKTKKHTMPHDRYRWLKKDFISLNTDFSGLDITGDDISLHTPLEYFQKFVSEDMTEALTQNTNEYGFQTHGTSVKTNAKEVEKMFGMYLKMGLLPMAGTRMYWGTETRYCPVADVPNPWGFKVWVRTGISGIMCDFDVYQGSVNGIRAKSELGLSGDVVMKLASTLPEGQNYKMYGDNYFTCVPLLVKLLGRGIHYVGTAKQVCLPNCNLEDEKRLKKKGRGSYDVKVEVNHNICAVKWYDNRAVTLLSSFAGPEPVQNIQCWDKANRTYIEVERPYIVGAYNKYMGGVDLLDSFTAKYKFPIKSRRWYMYIFWHTIILAVVNAWLL
ncbi:piggyBac transposable element-derived protein 1-like [Spinachia spinachia]